MLISAGNFVLKSQGGPVNQPHYFIQRFNNSSHKLQPAATTSCHQPSIPTGSDNTLWMAELGPNGSTQSGIKLFTTTSSGEKWFIRADAFGGAVDLVCPDHENHVSST